MIHAFYPVAMAEQPDKKTLSLNKTVPDNAQQPEVPLPRRRSGKRIIRREQLPVQSLANTKAPPAKPAKKKKSQKAPPTKTPTTPPSELRMEALNKQLCATFSIWRDHQPLALGIEKGLFRFIAAQHISASKRVVQKLLKRHTSSQAYRDNIQQQALRYELDGTPAGEISQLDKAHEQRQTDVAHST